MKKFLITILVVPLIILICWVIFNGIITYTYCRICLYFNVPRGINVKKISREGTMCEIAKAYDDKGVLIERTTKGQTFIALNHYPQTTMEFIRNLPIDGLTIRDSQINDLSPLNGHSLMFLEICNSSVSHLSSLKNIHLNSLFLKNIHIKKLILPKVQVLKILYLSNLSGFTSTVSISLLPELVELGINNCPIEDISPLKKCKLIYKLSLRRTKVKNISPLSDLTHLQILDLENNLVEDFSPLRKCKSIYRLSLNKTKVKDISSLRSLANLRSLNLESTLVEDISPLENLNLISLNIKNTPAAKKELPKWVRKINNFVK